MWGRVVEMMTAVWLLLSPYIFNAQHNPWILWGDTATALLLATLAACSFWHPLRHAHWANLLVALGLVWAGRFLVTPPGAPSDQNHIFVGFFLLMIAIIPNEASLPPTSWRDFIPQR